MEPRYWGATCAVFMPSLRSPVSSTTGTARVASWQQPSSRGSAAPAPRCQQTTVSRYLVEVGTGCAAGPVRVERCVKRLKQWRAVATRYEKRALNYRAVVVIAALIIW